MINSLMCSGTSFSEMTIFNKCGTIIFFTTIALFVIVSVIGYLVRYLNKDRLPDFFKYVLGILIGYSIVVIVMMLFLKFDEMISKGDFSKELFYPIMAIGIVGIAVAIGGLITSFLAPLKMKLYWIIGGLAFAVPVISAMVLLSKYYMDVIAPSGYYENVNTLWLSIGAAALVAILLAVTFIFGKKELKENHTKSIVYAAICIALSFALSYIRMFKLPQGGSITLVSVLPLMLYSYMFGIKKGVLAGFIYGVLQSIQDPWIIHPVQFLLDYPIAFAMIGLAGIFKNPKMLQKPHFAIIAGGALAGILRYLSHVISGIFAFSSFAAEGYSAIAWGFLYNSFALADMAIAITAGVLLLANRAFLKQINSINVATKIKSDTVVEDVSEKTQIDN